MDVQVSLMSHSRTDAQRPRSLSLASAAQILSMYSRNRPDRTSDHDNAWLSKVGSHVPAGTHALRPVTLALSYVYLYF